MTLGMLFLGGAGALIEASRAMAAIARQMEARAALSRMRARRVSGHVMKSYEGPRRSSFECFQLCGHCNYLSKTADADCASCGQREWIDLQHIDTSESLREYEEKRRMEPARLYKFISWVLAVATFALLTWWIGSWTSPPIPVLPALMLALFAALGIGFALPRPVSVLLLRWTPSPPRRWRLPLGLTQSRPEESLSIRLKAAKDERLFAPFSQRPCLAYRLAVRFDTPGDARPPEWVLHEADCVALQLDGQTVEGSRVLPELELEAQAETPLSDEELSVLLRRRGLFAADGEYLFFEAIVRNGDKVEVLGALEGSGVVFIHEPGVDTVDSFP